LNSAAVLLPPTRVRSQVDYRIAGSYFAGTTIGAMLTVMTAWVLSGFAAPVPVAVRAAMIVAGAVFIWLCERGPLSGRISLPQARRQIPAEVFGRGLVRGAFRFGFELGTGVRTYVPSPAPYILLLTILLGRLTLACALCVAAGFGLGRAVPLMIQISTLNRERVTQVFLRGAADVAPAASTCVVLAGALILV
jgi:hypothetical protein